MAGITKNEVKKIAITAPVTGYVAGVGLGTVVPTDTIKQAIEKVDGNAALAVSVASSAQVGNNLFNYYNFR